MSIYGRQIWGYDEIGSTYLIQNQVDRNVRVGSSPTIPTKNNDVFWNIMYLY